jgi:hypothetical protein
VTELRHKLHGGYLLLAIGIGVALLTLVVGSALALRRARRARAARPARAER